jgi:hypothetical protein
MTTKSDAYKLKWKFDSRITSQHFGALKYGSSTRAIGELVANSFDAGATVVDIELRFTELGAADSLVVADNGRGISPDDLANRFVVVGVSPIDQSRSGRIGKFGVGRMAVHRIGNVSDWTTVSRSKSGEGASLRFTLRSGSSGTPLTVEPATVAPDEPTGTRIEVFNLLDSGQEALTPARIRDHLLIQYCRYLLGHPKREIRVQGEALNVQQMVHQRETESIPASDDVPAEARIDHLLLTRPADPTRFPEQVLFSGKGGTVAGVKLEEAPSPFYLGLVECAYLDEIVTSNREGIVQMDGGFAHLREAVLDRVRGFGERFRAKQSKRFIEQARESASYPYRAVPQDSVEIVEQAVYDVTLEKLNESLRIDRMNAKQQSVIFRLWQRAVTNENMLPILSEVLGLKDEDVEKFRKLLETTKLDSIIRLASEVAARLRFLDVLHELVYGDFAKHVKERSQLHKILEPHCWLFGSKYHLAASDQQFRAVIRRHRTDADLDPIADDTLDSIAGINDIPDLFLAAQRDYPTDPPFPKYHRLLVELKRPSVSVGAKEVAQAKRYAKTVLKSAEFDQSSTHWDVFVVSSGVTGDIEEDRNQKGLSRGCVFDYDNVTVFVHSWGEIIDRARDEMRLVQRHLEKKSGELNVSAYLRANFPDIVLPGISEPTT